MTFSPDEFLQVAGSLTGSRSVERDWRTSAGRAYYANFLAARDALNVVVVDESVHKATERALADVDRVFAQTLGMLRRLRNACDYRMEVPVSKNEVTMHVALANQLIEDIRNITS